MLVKDPWNPLRSRTPARIALGRAGGSLPTAELLRFAADHARARDAVHARFDSALIAQPLESLGIPTQTLASQASDRPIYLARPDLGRRLDQESSDRLVRLARDGEGSGDEWRFDLAIIVSDGLSALAAHRHAVPVLERLVPELRRRDWNLAPVCLVPLARVAVEDEVGERLQARCALILLGERPGLLSPDSLGAYVVYHPRVGRTDAERNCVSNIRPEGLTPALAASTILSLLTAARERALTGVALKIEIPQAAPAGERELPDGR